MSARTSSSTLRSGGGRLLSPITDPQTYRNIAFLLLRLPFTIAYFTAFLTGVTLGVSLIPLVVGIPILGVVLGFAEYAARFEAAVCRRFLGQRITYTLRHNPGEDPLVPYLKSTLTDPRLYALVAYFLASQFIGIATFTLVVVVFTLGITLTVAPLAYPLPFTSYEAPQFDWAGGTVVIDTLPEALAASVVGLLVLFAGIHVSNALAVGHGKLTAAVFGDS